MWRLDDVPQNTRDLRERRPLFTGSRAPPRNSTSPIIPIPFIQEVYFLVLSLSLYVVVAFRDHRLWHGLPYPPGPPLWPIVGNLLDVPKEAP